MDQNTTRLLRLIWCVWQPGALGRPRADLRHETGGQGEQVEGDPSFPGQGGMYRLSLAGGAGQAALMARLLH